MLHTVPIQKSILITKAQSQQATQLAQTIARWLGSRGIETAIAENRKACTGTLLRGKLAHSLIIVLGGDGTLVSVARDLEEQAPLLGLNMGRVGFLAELSCEDWQQCLEKILGNGLCCEERLCLHYRLIRRNTEISCGKIINDLVVNRGALARLVCLNVLLDRQSLTQLRADGIIVATPTGSTAYSASSGGPIVYPQLNVFSVTPISPFLQNINPLVFPCDAELAIEVEQGSTETFLTLDGQECIPLEEKDMLFISRAQTGLLLVQTHTMSYPQRLRKKGFIG